jgi:hypothetical protein
MSFAVNGTTGITFNDNSNMATAASLGPRNRIINGNMAIDQRNAGASQTITSGNSAYTVDRWLVYTSGSNLTSQRVGSVGSYSLQLTGAAGNTAIQAIQRIESYNISDLAGQTVTLSFTVSSSSLTTATLYVLTPTSIDNYSATNAAVFIGSPSITSTPTRYSYTFTLPSTATNGAQIYIQTGAFTSGTLTITNVQLEVGSVATPYEFNTYSDQLAQCQRYYSLADFPVTINGYNAGSVSPWTVGYAQFVVSMRTAPTLTFGNQSFSSGNISNFRSTSTTANGFQIGVTVSAATAGWTAQATYTASAEL